MLCRSSQNLRHLVLAPDSGACRYRSFSQTTGFGYLKRVSVMSRTPGDGKVKENSPWAPR